MTSTASSLEAAITVRWDDSRAAYFVDRPNWSGGKVYEESVLAASQAREKVLRDALTDMLNGWKYIRESHGDLYGVGWDRAQQKAESALAGLALEPQP